MTKTIFDKTQKVNFLLYQPKPLNKMSLDFARLSHPEKLILADITGEDINKMYFQPLDLSCSEINEFEEKLTLLKKGYPLDYLLSQIDFLDLKIAVNPGVFVPRPETEDWVKKTQKKLNSTSTSQETIFVDLCAGTGIIGLYLAKKFPENKVISIEKDPKALKNIEQNKLLNKIFNIEILNSDLFTDFDLQGNQDWILFFNPPYVPTEDIDQKTKNNIKYEPELAIFSEDNGLTLYKEIIKQIQQFAHKPKICFFELDPRNIEEAQTLLNDLGYATSLQKDCNNLSRVLIGVLI